MKLNGAQIITRLLERQGVETVAGIPGGSTLPLYDALRESPIRHILARHEQGAGFIAQGMARATGKAGVCTATSGPGVMNLLTAVADARLDSVPLVAVTGQVPLDMIGTDAFQEIDAYGLSLPITKHNFLVRSAGELLEVIPEAFRIALSGRPGPVLVDVPKDVQTESTEVFAWPAPGEASPAEKPSREVTERLASMINRAKRPVLYIGGGIIASGASEGARAIARAGSIPVVSTLAGLGAFPADDPLSLGMLGMHGSRHANMALEETDLLIAAGVRFDDRATGRVSEFCPRAAVAHIDIDASEIGKNRGTDLAVVGDARQVLDELLPLVMREERRRWRARVAELKREAPAPSCSDISDPAGLTGMISRLAKPGTVVTTDVGQHQMWVAQHYPFLRPRSLLTSGGLGTMGFGLPAAIGAALALGGGPVLCVSGDGSILMNLQELATLAELGLDVKVVIMNNGHLGLVRQQQELFYGRRYYASRFESNLDFAAIAEAFGVRGVRIGEDTDREDALASALAGDGPALIDMPLHHGENVYPMVPPGGANREMIEGEVARVQDRDRA